MNYKKAERFLKSKLSDDFEITRMLGMYDKETRDLLYKLKNSTDIKYLICDNNSITVEEIKVNLLSLNVFIRKELYSEVKDCKKRFKIIYLIMEIYDKRHINILLVDNKNKSVERFDTFDEFTKRKEKVIETIIKKLNLDYKIINPKKYIFSKKRKDCGLCVPLSYLYAYIKMLYKLNLNEVINLLSNMTDKELFNISNWFINYLNLQ